MLNYSDNKLLSNIVGLNNLKAVITGLLKEC